ncbi:MAG: C40 family peptidase, partial [Eubacterium sp.]|nr:C40 family peptidase [Eubacterium sp.]
MTKTEKAVTWAIEIANDPAHGYDQDNRWGPDYDCSSLVISAWQQAGVPVKTKGAYNTQSMKSVFLSCGFKDVTSSVNLVNGSGMKRGDVLLNIVSHTVMHIGNGKVVAARINENGEDHGGTPGDQNGEEIKIQNYYNFPWDCVLRYTEDSSTTDPEPQPTTGNAKIRKGQGYANKFANAGISITGKRDAATKKAGVKVLQTALNRDYGAGLDVDGIWGTNTDNALGQHYVKNGETQY